MVVASLLLALNLAPQISIRVGSSRDSDSTGAERREVNRVRLTPALLATAFADEGARTLLERARVTRLQHDSTLTSYDARTYQRLSVAMGLGVLARERLAFRTENAARVRWRRDIGAVVDVRGSRTAVPIAGGAVNVEHEDAYDPAVDLAPIPYFPGKETLWGTSALARAEVDIQELINPLALGAEAYYVYATGDSVRFRFQDGRRIQLRELTVRPRRPSWNTVVASLWFDTGSGHLVRAAYRFSAPFKVWDAIVAENEQEDIPLIVRPILATSGFDLTSVMVEYALQENRWWLPRAQILEGRAHAAGIRVPIRIEERYEYTHVNGTLDSLPVVSAAQAVADSLWRDTSRRMHAQIDSLRDTMREGDSATRSALRPLIDSLDARLDTMRLARDSVRVRRRRAECAVSGSFTLTRRRYEGAIPVTATVPCDTAVLAHSPDLPQSIYDEGEEIMSGTSRDELTRALGLGAQAGWSPQKITLLYGPTRGLLRYNRVEGLSAGIGAEQQLGGGYTWDATAQIGFGDWQPNADVGISRSNGRTTLRAAAYRRLVSVSDWGAPLGLGNSLNALLFARDDGFYHRSLGAELTGQQGWRGALGWRLFAERQDEAAVETQFSLAHAINAVRFQDNVLAREGIWAGGAARWRSGLGLDPAHFRLFSDVRVEGAGGESNYGRGALDLTVTRALGSRHAFALTGGAGAAAGELPPQRFWLLGGAYTVRGQRPGAMSGNAYWLGRAELGRGWPGFRTTVFGDIGWAGDRDAWQHPGIPMSGAGVGASLLDGMVRFDVARGIRPERGVRVELYLDAKF